MTSVKVQIKCAVTLCHLNTCQQMDLFVIEHEDDLDTTDFHQSSDHGLSPLNSVLEAAKSGLAGHPDAAMDWNNERCFEVIAQKEETEQNASPRTIYHQLCHTNTLSLKWLTYMNQMKDFGRQMSFTTPNNERWLEVIAQREETEQNAPPRTI